MSMCIHVSFLVPVLVFLWCFGGFGHFFDLYKATKGNGAFYGLQCVPFHHEPVEYLCPDEELFLLHGGCKPSTK